jgi:hypothetical protein
VPGRKEENHEKYLRIANICAKNWKQSMPYTPLFLSFLFLSPQYFAKEFLSQSSSSCNFFQPPVTSSPFKSQHFPQYSVLKHTLPAINLC